MTVVLDPDPSWPKENDVIVFNDAPSVEYLVTKAQMDGGGTAHGPHDVYPDGWHVYAAMIDARGGVTEHKRDFWMSGSFTRMLTMDDLTVVGRARRSIVEVDRD